MNKHKRKNDVLGSSPIMRLHTPESREAERKAEREARRERREWWIWLAAWAMLLAVVLQ